ncbi:MAG TPA: tetratricopeptide repeat protein [Terriglobia bacterium]
MAAFKRSVAVLLFLAAAGAANGQSSYEADVAAGMKAYTAGDFSGAEKAFKRALKDVEAVSPTDARVGQVLVNLATVKMAQGAEKEVEPLLRRAIGVIELSLGADHPDLATANENLGMFYYDQLLAKAGTTRSDFRQHYSAISKISAASSSNVGLLPSSGAGQTTSGALAQAHQRAAKEDPIVVYSGKAEERLKKSLAIREGYFGATSAELLGSLRGLAELYVVLRRTQEAEGVLRRALEIRSSLGGDDDAYSATLTNMLASVYRNEKKYAEAEPLYLRALAIQEKLLGPAHPDLAPTLQAYALLLKETGRKDQSRQFESRAKDILKRNAS